MNSRVKHDLINHFGQEEIEDNKVIKLKGGVSVPCKHRDDEDVRVELELLDKAAETIKVGQCQICDKIYYAHY